MMMANKFFFSFFQNNKDSDDESSNDDLPFAPYVTPPCKTPEKCDSMILDIESAHFYTEADSILKENIKDINNCAIMHEQICVTVN